MLPPGFKKPDAVFYTHSHSDHYNARAAIETLHANVVYVGDTWVERAKADLARPPQDSASPRQKSSALRSAKGHNAET